MLQLEREITSGWRTGGHWLTPLDWTRLDPTLPGLHQLCHYSYWKKIWIQGNLSLLQRIIERRRGTDGAVHRCGMGIFPSHSVVRRTWSAAVPS